MRVASAATLAALLVVAGPAGAALAGGSDSPTPYTVTAGGVRLPAGVTFESSGHVNYKATDLTGADKKGFGTHFDPNNGQPGGIYIGAEFYDFAGAAAAFPEGYCITWVQVSKYNEHFGEGGQEPVCTDTPGTTPPVTPPGEETEVPVEEPELPVEEPEVPGEDTEEPGEETEVPGEDTRPQEPGTELPGTTGPEDGEDSTTDETGTGDEDDDRTGHLTDGRSEDETGTDLGTTVPVSAPAAEQAVTDELATTGTSTALMAGIAAALVGGGTLLTVLRLRNRSAA
ncbi:hypothetical protein [Oerskovia flava]|uniref:hypothetical protein n=1 Tax=Oerskovia flava TaxID=2986422 RepID=UPI002240D32B|nr:hypothetical protein [Oerskovia sp. JB1-3-2]